MSEPLVFISTWTLKPGKLEAWKKYQAKWVERIEEQEPQLIAFQIFLNDEGTEVTGLQVHPDSASMEYHMQVIGPHLKDAFEYLGETKQVQLYGSPSDELLASITANVSPGTPFVRARGFAGFTRSSAEQLVGK